MREPRSVEYAPMLQLSSPRFLAYLLAQFLGSLNDNAFKMTLILFILVHFPDEAVQTQLSSIATALFPLPFILFSPLAGWLADRYPKGRVLFFTKLPEIFAMGLGAIGFALGNLPFLFGVLFLMSLQSALFSPAKYGILPEAFSEKDLAEANGILSMTTHLATLFGMGVGIAVHSIFQDDLSQAGWMYVTIAAIGTTAAWFSPRGAEGNPRAPFDANPLRTVQRDWGYVRGIRALPQTIYGLAYFSCLGSLLLGVIPIYGVVTLGLTNEKSASMLALLGIGIAAGSVVAGKLSRGKIELGLVPLGALGMTCGAFDLSFFGDSSWRISDVPVRAITDMALIGFCGGLFSIPLNALLQTRSPDGAKGQVIAFSNIASFSGVLIAAVFSYVLAQVPSFRIEYVIFAFALITIAGTVYTLNLLPEFLVRFLIWIVLNLMYRIHTVGRANIPERGALIVANHVSWIDGLLVAATSGQMVRFLMYRPYYENPMLHWFFKRMHVIPVASGDPAERTRESIEMARAEIEAGHTVCIFAEGTITRTGQLLSFRRGFERIVEGLDCPIIPVCLDGLWGSIFSFERGRVLLKRPRRFRHPLHVHYGEHLPSSARAGEVRQAVQELSVDAFESRTLRQRPLAVELLRSASRHWWNTFLYESGRRKLRYRDAWQRALAIRDQLFAIDDGIRNVGILLPPGIDAAIANLTILTAGKLPINLHIRSETATTNAVASAGIEEIISTRSLLRTMDWDPDWESEKIRFLDDLNFDSPAPTRLLRSFVTLLFPLKLAAWVLLWGNRDDPSQAAAVLFSRGTAGTPNGIIISHKSILSNIEAFRQVFEVESEDVVLGVMPLSHPFGFTGTFCLPAIAGAQVVYHPDVNDVEGINQASLQRQPTIVLGTPEFLDSFTTGVSKEAFKHVRNVVSGGNLLPPRVREDFESKFGIGPLEGYGCSELAPLIALNVPDAPSGNTMQTGNRPGSIGHPLPGFAVRVVDPATGEPSARDTLGLLAVKGPGVIHHVLKERESPFALEPDWQIAPDWVSMDRDGFLRIWDRADRVAKVAGELVPLTRLEAAIRDVIYVGGDRGLEDRARFTVVTRPDDDGVGDKLTVFYEDGVLNPMGVRDRLRENAFPPHWIPAIEEFHPITEIPLRETGHIDHYALPDGPALRPKKY